MHKISVVTVTYNCRNTIESTLNSVIKQTYNLMEYIVIDGASCDGTCQIIEKYGSKISYWLSEPDKGIFDAMNKALQFVTGDYVIFLNSGDLFVSSDILSRIFEGKTYKEDLIFGDVYIRNKLGYLLCRANPIYNKKNKTKKDYVFTSQGICHQALLTKSSILKAIKFNVKYRLGADYDTTAKVFSQGNGLLCYVGFPVAIFDDLFGGASHNQTAKVLQERAEMFHYPKCIYFYYLMGCSIVKQKFKMIIGFMFYPLVMNFRKRKYLSKV